MTIRIVKDKENNTVHAHLHNRNDVFMARVEIPEHVDHECHSTLYDYLRVYHSELLKRIR